MCVYQCVGRPSCRGGSKVGWGEGVPAGVGAAPPVATAVEPPLSVQNSFKVLALDSRDQPVSGAGGQPGHREEG